MSATEMARVLGSADRVVLVETPSLHPSAAADTLPEIAVSSDQRMAGAVLVVPTLAARYRFDLAEPPAAVWFLNWGLSAPSIAGLDDTVRLYRSGWHHPSSADIARVAFDGLWGGIPDVCVRPACDPVTVARDRLKWLHQIEPDARLAASTRAPTRIGAREPAGRTGTPRGLDDLDPVPAGESLAYRRLMATVEDVRGHVLESYLSRIAESHPEVAHCARRHLADPVVDSGRRLDDGYYHAGALTALVRVNRFRDCALPWRTG
jgi:hypothetical protein